MKTKVKLIQDNPSKWMLKGDLNSMELINKTFHLWNFYFWYSFFFFFFFLIWIIKQVNIIKWESNFNLEKNSTPWSRKTRELKKNVNTSFFLHILRLSFVLFCFYNSQKPNLCKSKKTKNKINQNKTKNKSKKKNNPTTKKVIKFTII